MSALGSGHSLSSFSSSVVVRSVSDVDFHREAPRVVDLVALLGEPGFCSFKSRMAIFGFLNKV